MPPTTVSRVDCQRKVADLERRVEGQKDKSRAEVQELPAGSSDDDEPYDDDDLQGQLDDAHEALEQARQLEGKEVEAEARKRRSNKKKKGGAEEGEGGSEGDGEGEGEAGVDKVEIEKDDDDPYRSFGRYVYCKANGNTALEALDLEVVKQKVEGLKAARGACQGGGGVALAVPHSGCSWTWGRSPRSRTRCMLQTPTTPFATKVSSVVHRRRTQALRRGSAMRAASAAHGPLMRS